MKIKVHHLFPVGRRSWEPRRVAGRMPTNNRRDSVHALWAAARIVAHRASSPKKKRFLQRNGAPSNKEMKRNRLHEAKQTTANVLSLLEWPGTTGGRATLKPSHFLVGDVSNNAEPLVTLDFFVAAHTSYTHFLFLETFSKPLAFSLWLHGCVHCPDDVYQERGLLLCPTQYSVFLRLRIHLGLELQLDSVHTASKVARMHRQVSGQSISVKYTFFPSHGWLVSVAWRDDGRLRAPRSSRGTYILSDDGRVLGPYGGLWKSPLRSACPAASSFWEWHFSSVVSIK